MWGVCITAGVYGVIAVIVKLDDAGLLLIQLSGGQSAVKALGRMLVEAMPHVMRILTIAGTVAMFMVGGGILAHGVPWLEVSIESLSGLFLPGIKAALLHICVGVFVGTALLGVVGLVKRIFRKD